MTTAVPFGKPSSLGPIKLDTIQWHPETDETGIFPAIERSQTCR